MPRNDSRAVVIAGLGWVWSLHRTSRLTSTAVDTAV